MKNIQKIELSKLQDTGKYEPAGSDIYKDINDSMGFAGYRMAVSMELEEGENTQYPLEDILDKYSVHVEEFLESGESGTVKNYLLGGELDSLQNFSEILGKRAYNVEYDDAEGKTRVKLVIE